MEKPKNNLEREILAVIVGAIIDMGGTNLIALIYMMIVFFQKAFNLASQGLSQSEIQTRLIGESSKISTSPIMIILGLLLSLLGGFVAGKIAKDKEVLYGVLVGILILIVSTACGTGLRSTLFTSLWKIFLLVLSIGLNALGGYLAYLQRVKRARLTTN